MNVPVVILQTSPYTSRLVEEELTKARLVPGKDFVVLTRPDQVSAHIHTGQKQLFATDFVHTRMEWADDLTTALKKKNPSLKRVWFSSFPRPCHSPTYDVYVRKGGVGNLCYYLLLVMDEYVRERPKAAHVH